MGRFITSIWFLVFFAQVLHAQTHINGSVVDNTQTAIPSAIVSVKDNGKTIAYAITKKDGSFNLSFTSKAEMLIISAEQMSYKKEEKTVPNKAQAIHFVLEEQAMQLKEAVVSAPVVTRIGDTLRFNLPALVSKGDVSLEDALKKVPGISVADNGEIRYLGRAISNFYVEGLEMLNGNYTLTTRNLPAGHVASVEVLNNHNAVKMEKDKISDKVALNVKLKKDAYFKPVGTSELAGGYSSERMLYTAGATGMLFGGKGQVLVSAKVGNIDDFAVSQSSSLTGSSSSQHLAVGEIGQLRSSTPSLGVSRYLNMDGRLVSANTILKISEDKTLRINTSYAFQKQRNQSSVRSAYYLGEGDYLELDKSYAALSGAHMPVLSLQYQQNSEKRFILYSFDFSGNFADYSLPVVENGIPVDQDQKQNSYQISNELICGFKTGVLEWSSQTRIKYAGTPTLRLDISSPHDAYNATQTALSRTFNIYQYLNTSYKFGQSLIILPITLDISDHVLETGLLREGLVSQNLIKGMNGELKINPNYTYTSLDKRFKLSAHFSLRGVFIKGENQFEDGPGLDFKGLYIDPNLMLNYAISPESELQFRSSHTHNHGSITTLLSNPVMHDYRRMSSKPGTLAKNRKTSVSLSWRYNNPVSLWFGSWRIGYDDTFSNIMPSVFMTGDSSSSSSVENDNHSQTASSNAEISKRISSIKGKFTIRGGWNWSKSGTIQQNLIVTYYGNGYNAGADVTLQPVDWMEASLSANWSLTSTRFASVSNTYRNLTGRATLSFYPVKDLTIKLNGDYSHLQLSDGKYKDMTLFDASVSYKIKSFTLMLSANNLLDQTHYTYTVFSGLDTHSYDYTLRPREIVLSVQFTM